MALRTLKTAVLTLILSLSVVGQSTERTHDNVPQMNLLPLTIKHPGEHQLTREMTTLAAESLNIFRWTESSWLHQYEEVYQYNVEGQQVESARYYISSGIQFNDWRLLWSYDDQGLLEQQVYQTGLVSEWFNEWRHLFSYDSSSRLIDRTLQVLNNSTWEDREQLFYVYDAEDRLSVEVHRTWVVDYWLNDFRMVYDYGLNNALVSSQVQLWNYDDDIWMPDSLHSFELNSNDDRTEWLIQVWDGSQWLSLQRTTYSYAESNELISEIDQVWLGHDWYNVEKRLHTWDDNGFEVLLRHQDWDYDAAVWYDSKRKLKTYDVDGNQLTAVFQNWGEDELEWINDWRYQWTYPTSSTWVNLLPEKFHLEHNFPNPFNPSTSIRFTLNEQARIRLDVFDVKGQKVKTLQNGVHPAGRYAFEWNGIDQWGQELPTGVYFCRLQAGSHKQTIKMILLR